MKKRLFKTKVIVNPYSAFGETGKKWSKLKELIKTKIKEFTYEFTEKPKDAIYLTKEALKEGFERIVSVGGDGTLNEVVNGYFENKKPINENAFVSILPSGKGNDFIKSFPYKKGIISSHDEINLFTVDTGIIKEKNGEEKKFINVASFGFSRDVVESVLELREKIKSGIAYFLGVFKALKKFKAKKIKITVDEKVIDDYFSIGVVANGKSFAGGMLISPFSRPDDGMLEVVLLKNVSKLKLISLLAKVYSGKHINSDDIIFLRGKKVSVEPLEKSLGGEYDGEIDITYPVEFTLLEKKLKIGL